jgi:hypothetical protein
LTFDKFDEKVVSWGRLKYGERYATALWRNELIDLNSLDLKDELDQYTFDEYCSMVNDVISCESPKYASSLFKDKRFATVKWQYLQGICEINHLLLMCVVLTCD